MALVCEARGFGDLVRLELVQPYEVAGAATYAEPVYEDPAYEEAEYAEAEYDDGSGGEEASGGSYVVQSGDTLSGIAAELGTSVDSLMAANGLTDPDLFYAGQTLSY
jgi:LysM repeat protein